MSSAYLLAAGRGRRAGGPKAWQARGGVPMLPRQLWFLLERFAPERIAVSIQPGWEERCREIHPAVAWTPVDPDGTPLASLQALVARRPLDDWGFVYHVDMPVWEPALFDALEAAKAEEAVVPVHGGRRGHPVLLSPQLAAPLAALDPAEDRLDAFLRSRRLRELDVPQACVLDNWNAPA